ncbi:recombinase family protein [Sphingomonas sp. DT-51]
MTERESMKQVRAFSYQRFSSPSQADGDSLARQSSLAKAYADEHGLLLDDSLTYCDLGVSGFRGQNATHGALACFLEAVRSERIAKGSVLLIESLDRLSRDNILRAQAILTDLIASGIQVVSLADRRLYSVESLTAEPLGLIYALIVFMRANEESSTKSLRARESWIRRREAARSTVISTRVPDWLTVEGGRIVPVPERADVLKRIFDMALNGIPAKQIAIMLNYGQLPRWQQADRAWTRATVQTLLSNPRVTGALPLFVSTYDDGAERRVPTDVLAGYFPNIVDPAIFLSVQARVARWLQGGNAAKSNAFANLLVCAGCGADVRFQIVGRSGRPVLVCAAAQIAHNCSAPEIDYEAFQARAGAALCEWVNEDLLWAGTNAMNALAAPIAEKLDGYARLLPALVAEHGLERATKLVADPVAALEDELDGALFEQGGEQARLIRDCSIVLQCTEKGMHSLRSRVDYNAALHRLFTSAVTDLRSGAATFYSRSMLELRLAPD